MKEKIKNTKGITLVALIITIIVLLILAVVGITSINNNKILEYAKNGRDAYNQGETNETETITEYEKYLDDNNPTFLALNNKYGNNSKIKAVSKIPFSSDRKYSGVILKDKSYIMGAPEFVLEEKYDIFTSKQETNDFLKLEESEEQ